MNKKTAIGALALIGALLWWFTGDSPSDEDLIRGAIEQVAEGAENADLAMCIEPFSRRYADPEGLERKSIQGILWQHFRKRGPISVWLGEIQVQVAGDTATADFDVGLTEGAEGSRLGWPVSADALTFEVDLAREAGEWRITSHTRRPVFSAE